MLTSAAAPHTGIIGRRYVLHEQLGAGGMGAVFRAADRLTGQMVALKQVTAPAQALLFTSRSEGVDLRLALAQEFRLLASVRHPNIISVLDYGFDERHQPFFTMELLENAQTIFQAGKGQALNVKIDLLVQMLQALAYLHRRGIIHHDLKPSNVMVVGRQVKLLDFGLSISGEQVEKSGAMAAGTLAYMAPEVLQGAGASRASDLYAVGVMAYELLAGRHPFDVDDMTRLITDILTTPPDIAALDVDLRLSALLERLLAKDPDARYSDAYQVIKLFSQAADQPIPLETAATRESFLQAARLVGRDAELHRLSDALTHALHGRGSVWLVGGESGVGKSRLLDELRTLALVKGAMVVRGQSVSEGGKLYGLWRPVLRWLCIAVTLDDHEAGVIKPLVADIADLLGRDVPDAPPESNPQAAQERLFRTIEALFRRLPQALVVILEDLHWANESLDVLGLLKSIAPELPLLILGSYRDDERPELPADLGFDAGSSGLSVLKLSRLGHAEIAELSEAMLGRAGRQREVVDLLRRETEGNVFFLVEVVRALAEEAGQLENIGQRTLPEQVFAGGVRQIVQRRLSRVPADYYPLLQKAAVAGRQLDLDVLRTLSGQDDLSAWLTACSDAAVLEVQDDRWRFAHDKLREGVLADIPADERGTLHAQIAAAIEGVYGQTPEQAAVLAHHWSAAGHDEKHAHYAILAGDLAMQNGVNREALGFFTRAVEALHQLPMTPDRQRLFIDVVVKLTRVGAYTVRDENLVRLLEQGLSYARALQDEVREARLVASLGTFYYVMGRMGDAFPTFTQVIGLAEKLELEELLLLPYSFIGRALVINGDLPKGSAMLARGIALAEKFNDLDLLAGSLAFRAVALWVQGQAADGNEHAKRAMQWAEQLGHPSRITGNLITLASGLCLWGRIDDAHEHARRGLDIAEQTQDLQPLYAGNAVLGYTHYHQGRIAEGIHHLEIALDMGNRANLMLNRPFYLAWRAEADLLNGDAQAALTRAENALKLAETIRQSVAQADALRVLGAIYAQMREWDKAEQALEQAIALHRQNNAQTLAARCVYDQSRLYAACGRSDLARAKLETALALFEEFQVDWFTRHARAALGMV